MTKTLLVAAAWLLYCVAWFLPAYSVGYSTTISGWEAFWVTLAWPWSEGAPWYAALHPVFLGALTNLLMVASPLLPWRRSAGFPRTLAWAAAAAFFLNGYWLTDNDGSLRIGFFLWWFSFLILALGMSSCARTSRLAPSAHTHPREARA